LATSLQAKDLVGNHWQHGGHGAIAHETQTDHYEVSGLIIDCPVDGDQHGDLNAEYDEVDGLKSEAVKE
jgi:hypothetical protein